MTTLREYQATFGSQYNPRQETHPTFPRAHRDGWVTVLAPTYDAARDEVERRLGFKWSMLYGPEDPLDPGFFPLGEIARWDVTAARRPAIIRACTVLREGRTRVLDGRTGTVVDTVLNAAAYGDADHALHNGHFHEQADRDELWCLGWFDAEREGEPAPRTVLRTG